MIAISQPDRRPPPATNGIVLGWKLAEKKKLVGFDCHEAAAAADYEPVVYEGDGHLLTIAKTGAGKGVASVIPTLLTNTNPVIALDLKGELHAVAARRRREMGHRVVVIEPFRQSDEQRDAVNPFDIFNMNGAVLEADAETLAASLSVGHRFQSDPYWTGMANELISGLIADTAMTAPPENRNLNEVRQRLFVDDFDYSIACRLDSKQITSPMVREKYVGYLTAPADKTRPCILSTAQSHFANLGSESVTAALGKSTFDLKDVVAGEAIDVFIVIPPNRLDSHAPIVRILLTTFLTAIISRSSMPPQCSLLLLDEAGQLGDLDALRQIVTLFRGSGVTAWMFFQDLSQIRRNFSHDWETIVNNCSVIQSFGVPTPLMAGAMANLVDVPPHKLIDLPGDHQALHIQGSGSQIARKLNYLRDPAFAGLFDANPRYARRPTPLARAEKGV